MPPEKQKQRAVRRFARAARFVLRWAQRRKAPPESAPPRAAEWVVCMKIKAAVFDIDGTLVPYGAPGPGQAAVQALRELAQSGVAVVIATGRARIFD